MAAKDNLPDKSNAAGGNAAGGNSAGNAHVNAGDAGHGNPKDPVLNIDEDGETLKVDGTPVQGAPKTKANRSIINTNDTKVSDLDDRDQSAIKSIKANKPIEGVKSWSWNPNDPAVYVIDYEDAPAEGVTDA